MLTFARVLKTMKMRMKNTLLILLYYFFILFIISLFLSSSSFSKVLSFFIKLSDTCLFFYLFYLFPFFIIFLSSFSFSYIDFSIYLKNFILTNIKSLLITTCVAKKREKRFFSVCVAVRSEKREETEVRNRGSARD